MTVKLKKIAPKYKDKFVIEVEFMHGDADADSTETYVCKDEAEFVRIMNAESEGPESPGSGGDEDEYNDFYADLFGEDFVPSDVTCCDYPACVEAFNGFYYDKDGTAYTASL